MNVVFVGKGLRVKAVKYTRSRKSGSINYIFRMYRIVISIYDLRYSSILSDLLNTLRYGQYVNKCVSSIREEGARLQREGLCQPF